MLSLKDIQKEDNLTPLLEEGGDHGENYLARMGRSVVRGYQIDLDSRSEWEEIIDQAMDIAKQVLSEKNFPWPKSANIKYPLICEAAIDFAARLMPEMIPNDKIVQAAITGKDDDGSKMQRAQRISDYISYQCLSSPDWQEGLDSLLHILPVVGTVFKKTFYSETEKRMISEVCSPQDIVVNYATKSLDTARRITHKIKLSLNDVIERQRRGLFNKNVDIELLRPEDCDPDDDDYEIEFLEQHCWWDLDDDGYKEPYIVTTHENTYKVLRIVSIIDEIEKVEDKESGEKVVARITAVKYFTDYHFIPSPDGGFYSMGFGSLLLPINKSINTLINQLLDAGTVSVTQGGFIGKGLRLRDGETRFKPYEWKVCDAAPGTDLGKNIFPFPVREPSQVLYNLLTLMIQMGKELTNSTEALNGNMTGSNVSDKTMNTLVEQGSKIFVAIYKRFLRSSAKEYQKIYNINYNNLSDADYQSVLDIPDIKVKEDFEKSLNDVRPIADPVFSSLQQRLSKLSVLMNLRTADPRAVDMYALEVLQFNENQIKSILPKQDPNQPPPPKDQKDLAQAEQAKAQAVLAQVEAKVMMGKAPLDMQLGAKQLELTDSQIGEAAARVGKMRIDAAHGDQKMVIAAAKVGAQTKSTNAKTAHQDLKDAATTKLKDKELNIKASKTAAELAIDTEQLRQNNHHKQQEIDINKAKVPDGDRSE